MAKRATPKTKPASKTKQTPAKKAPAKKTVSKKATAKKTASKKTAPAKKAASKKSTVKKSAAKKAPAKAPAKTNKPAAPAAEVSAPAATAESFAPVYCFIGASRLKLWGKSCEDRLRLQFSQNGLDREITLDEAENHNGTVILLRADCILDAPLVPVLIKRPNFALMSSDGNKPLTIAINGQHAKQAAKILAGEANIDDNDLKLVSRSPADMEVNFWRSLRKREVPYAIASQTGTLEDIEWRMFMGTYKGATDLVTKFLWPVPAFHVTRRIAPMGITPNMVTSVGAILMIAAFFLFLNGHYIAGLISGWLMTFLDTVDGKLARTTLTSSKWGNIFDHGIDLIHPPFWYLAWGIGLQYVGQGMADDAFFWLMVVIFGGYIIQRIMEGIALRGLNIQIHIWRPIDTHFRLITARRNPNMVILTLCALIGRPDLGLYGIAWWVVICLVLHAVQLAQAISAYRRDGKLVSWLTGN